MFFLRGVVTSAQAQGPRHYQEDYMVHLPFVSKKNGRGHLLGVMDGHGGGEVAKYCAGAILRLFNPNALNIENELLALVKKLDANTCLLGAGSTLSLACVNESQGIVTTAVLGDSPIIVVDHKGSVQRSVEHNVRCNLSEREAAVCRGAIYRDDGYIVADPYGDGIQLSRALGDQAVRKILDQTPVISSYRIGFRGQVIVASDGLFDPSHEDSSDEAMQKLITIVQNGGSANDVLFQRETEGFDDNTSIVVWRSMGWWGSLLSLL